MKSTVKQVTIYRSGAMITRTASVHLDVGATRLVFDDIPVNPDEISLETIQIFLEKAVNCNQISFRQKTESEQSAVSEYNFSAGQETRIAECKKRLQEIDLLVQLNRQEIQTLLDHAYPQAAEVELSLTYIQDFLEYHFKKQKELKQEILSLEEEQSGLQKEVAELEKAAKGKTTASGEIILDVFTDREMDTAVDISYYSYGVKWYPFYDVIGNTSCQRNSLQRESLDSAVLSDGNVAQNQNQTGLLFCLKAKVTQTTGEDWENVRVNISTGNLMRSNSRPELKEWVVEKAVSYPHVESLDGVHTESLDWAPKAQRMKNPTIASTDETILLSESKRQRIRPNRQNTEQDQGIVMEYHLDDVHSIQSGREGNILMIKDVFLPAEYRYYITPKAECSAFLTAVIKEWRHANLLDCDANLFMDHCYVGTTHISPEKLEDALYISLGRDKGISVERLKVKETRSKSLVGNRLSRDFYSLIRIKNNKVESIKTIIEDQVPVTHDDKIKVEILQKSGAELTAENGKLIWKKEIACGEQAELHVDFRVSYPADMRVNL